MLHPTPPHQATATSASVSFAHTHSPYIEHTPLYIAYRTSTPRSNLGGTHRPRTARTQALRAPRRTPPPPSTRLAGTVAPLPAHRQPQHVALSSPRA
eukprot:2836862-Rhodomonas_salina.5